MRTDNAPTTADPIGATIAAHERVWLAQQVLHRQGGWIITREDPCLVHYPHTPSVMLYAVRIDSGRLGWYRCLRGAHGEWLIFDLRHLAPDLEDEGGVPTAERIASALVRRYPYEAYLRAAAQYHHQAHWLPRGCA